MCLPKEISVQDLVLGNAHKDTVVIFNCVLTYLINEKSLLISWAFSGDCFFRKVRGGTFTRYGLF